MRGTRRRLVDLGSTVALLAVWWILLSPVAFGGKTSFVVVQGRSMEPWYSTGDLVVARAASEYRVDDVVVFRLSDQRRSIIHRIVGGDEAGGWTTRGDGNERDDSWTVPDDAIIGRELLVIPRVASAITAVHKAPLRFAAIVGTVVAVLTLLPPSHGQQRTGRLRGQVGTPQQASFSLGLAPDAAVGADGSHDRGSPAVVTVATPFDEVVARLDELLLGLRTPE
jgi:signal peptidase I